jgi:hypothetical protein
MTTHPSTPLLEPLVPPLPHRAQPATPDQSGGASALGRAYETLTLTLSLPLTLTLTQTMPLPLPLTRSRVRDPRRVLRRRPRARARDGWVVRCGAARLLREWQHAAALTHSVGWYVARHTCVTFPTHGIHSLHLHPRWCSSEQARVRLCSALSIRSSAPCLQGGRHPKDPPLEV